MRKIGIAGLPALFIFIYYSYSFSNKMNCDFKKCITSETIKLDYCCRHSIMIKSKMNKIQLTDL